MSFQQRAQSLASKAHVSGVRLPILVGLTVLALVAAIVVGKILFDAATTQTFSVTTHDQTEESVQDNQTAQSDQTTQESDAEANTIAVYVTGAVKHPGVCEVPEGARVQAAIDACGGFSEDAATDALNLARVLTDGEQIDVLTLDEQQAQEQAQTQAATSAEGASSGQTQPSASNASSLVNINTATTDQLDALPGVGPATAEKIVADREANGPFQTIEDLKRVSGIGDKKYADLAGLICVG